MTKTSDIIYFIAKWLVIVLVVTLFAGLIYEGISSIDRHRFCKETYPADLPDNALNSNVWSDSRDIEPGYLRCCRKYAEDHELKKECKIFRYDK